MPAREIFFSFDKKLKINEKTVLEFIKDFEYEIEDNISEISAAFNTSDINQDFLKAFIKTMKSFDSVSIEDDGVFGRERIVKDFIWDILGEEIGDAQTILGIRYLYDEWEYEGTGYDDHYYLTYTDDVKLVKKTVKETQKLVDRLKQLGVDVQFSIKALK